MKAFVYDAYGPPEVLYAKEILSPIPKHTELLVRVHASSVSAGMTWMRKGEFPGSKLFTFLLRLQFGISKPKQPILGCEFSGIIEAIGKDVKRFKNGDAVYGTTTGLANGAYADYVCVPELPRHGVVMLKPTQLTFSEAAALPVGGMTALQILQKNDLKFQSRILIYGASGSVGSYAVQIARYFGAHVTAVCSTANLGWVKAIGAHEVIDYTSPGWWQKTKKFDLVFDAVGKLPASQRKSLLGKRGKFCSTKCMTYEKASYLELLQKIIAEGKLKPIIDKVYLFEQMVEAHHHVDLGHKKGNIIINHAPQDSFLLKHI